MKTRQAEIVSESVRVEKEIQTLVWAINRLHALAHAEFLGLTIQPTERYPDQPYTIDACLKYRTTSEVEIE